MSGTCWGFQRVNLPGVSRRGVVVVRASKNPKIKTNRQPITRSEPKIGRNDPCPCGSGKKYKRCCSTE